MTKLHMVLVAVALLFLSMARSISADLPDKTFPEWTNLGIEVPGSVYGATWNPGCDRVSAMIQINYIPVKDGEAGKLPKTQVWLLKTDGSVIPQKGPHSTGIISGPGTQYHLGYHYDHAAVVEAVAVAVMIEGQYFIKALPPVEKSIP